MELWFSHFTRSSKKLIPVDYESHVYIWAEWPQRKLAKTIPTNISRKNPKNVQITHRKEINRNRGMRHRRNKEKTNNKIADLSPNKLTIT